MTTETTMRFRIHPDQFQEIADLLESYDVPDANPGSVMVTVTHPVVHEIAVDSVTTAAGDYQAKAFCACGWSDVRWHHADEYPAGDWESDPTAAEDAAYRATHKAGAEHLQEVSR